MIYQNKEYYITDNKHDLMEKLHMPFRADIHTQDKKYQLSESITMTKAIDKEYVQFIRRHFE